VICRNSTVLSGSLHTTSSHILDVWQFVKAPKGNSCDAERTVCESVHP